MGFACVVLDGADHLVLVIRLEAPPAVTLNSFAHRLPSCGRSYEDGFGGSLAPMRIYLTGEVCVESDRMLIREGRLPGRQGRQAFAYLVWERRRAVSHAELAELLWPDGLPVAWAAAIAAIVSKLRSVLDSAGHHRCAIRAAFSCYQVKLPHDTWVDVEVAQQSLHEAEAALRAGDPGHAYGPAVVAATILRRPFLAGAEGPWVDARRDILKSQLVRTLDCLVDLHRWNREPGLGIQVAEELLSLEPYRETAWRSLMLLHVQVGNRGEALSTYRHCHDILATQLGTVPTEETEALMRKIARI